MLLKETWDEKLLGDKTKFFQIKYNGVRALAHISGHKITGLRNRTGSPILYLYPELRTMFFNVDTAILDCEVCVFKDGKSIFYGGIDQRRKDPSPSVIQQYPVTLVAYDILRHENDTLVYKSYRDRYAILGKVCSENTQFQIAPIYHDGTQLWRLIKDNDFEGMVIKDPLAIYELGKRSDKYLKLKNYKQAEVHVLSIEPNNKGTKIYGHTTYRGQEIDVEAQLAGVFDIQPKQSYFVKFLEVVGNRLIQPTKIRNDQKEWTTTEE